MAKAAAKAKTVQLPPGFKMSETNNRKGVKMFLLFVDKDAGIYESRKGALARCYSEEEIVAAANSKEIQAKVARVGRTASPKPAQKPARASHQTPVDANDELETIE